MRVMIPPDAEGISEIRQNGRTAIGVGVFLDPRAQIRRRSLAAIFPNARTASPATDDSWNR